jgi:type IV pilus assembly protein PilB
MKTVEQHTHAPRNIAEVLLGEGLLTQAQHDEALRIHRRTDKPLARVLREMGAVDPAVEASILHDHCHCETVDLEAVRPDPQALALLSRRLCTKHHALPLAIRNGRLQVAMEDPTDLNAVGVVESAASMPVDPVLARAESLERAIERLPLRDEGEAVGPSPRAVLLWRVALVVVGLAPVILFYAMLGGDLGFRLWWVRLHYDPFEVLLIFPLVTSVWASIVYWIMGLLPGAAGAAAR